LLKNWLSQNRLINNQEKLLLLLIISFFKLTSQVNYVGNPSFEMFHSGCTGPNFVSKLKYWGSLDSNLSWAGGALYNTCYSNVPYGGPGLYQAPRTGNSLIRTTFFCSTVTCSYYSSRTYPKNRLLNTLTSGTTYCVKMWVNLQNNSPYSIDSLQIYFGDVSLDTIKYCTMPLTYLTPQVTNTLGIISDTLNWIEVKGTFVANGSEKYMVIGNFQTDTQVAATYSPTGTGSGVWAEYMIDDVSVIDFNLPAYAGLDQNIPLGDSAFIGRPPEIGLECTWTTGTTTVGTSGGIWVKPTSTGTYSYVVTQNICGNIKTDTVNVNISSGIEESIVFAQSISIYPQPAKDVLSISLYDYYEPRIQLRVMDVNGRTMRSSELVIRNGKTELNLGELTNGVYIIQFQNSKGQISQKKLVIAK
jgi:hypothetical protein